MAINTPADYIMTNITIGKLLQIYSEPAPIGAGMGMWFYFMLMVMTSIGIYAKTSSIELVGLMWLITSSLVIDYIPREAMFLVWTLMSLIIANIIYKLMRSE